MYKPKMKQRLSFLMAFAMLFSFTGMKVFANKATTVAPTVQAEHSIDMVSEDSIDTNEEIITISANVDGTYSSVANASLRASTLQIRVSAEYEDIYTTSDSRYFQEVSNGTYQEVQPVGGELTAYSTYQTMETLDLPEEVMAGIAQMAAIAEEKEMDDAAVTVFVPSAEKQNSTRETTQVYPRTATIWAGKTFYHYQVYFTGLDDDCSVVPYNEITRSTLEAPLDVLFALIKKIGEYADEVTQELIEELSLYVQIFTWAYTILDAWEEVMTGHINYGDTENSIKAIVFYRLHQKYTYYYDGSTEHFGCRSQRAFVQRILVDVTLNTDEGNGGVDRTITPNDSTESYFYSGPEETAYVNYRNIGYFDEAQGTFSVGNDETTTLNFQDRVLVEWPSGWPSRPPVEP